MNDELEYRIAAVKAEATKTLSYYREHLRGVVSAYRQSVGKHEPEVLLNSMVKAYIEGNNTREELCYQIVAAIEALAKRST